MDKICVRCGMESNSNPLCDGCKEKLSEFKALAEFLNSFTGKKEDLLSIIRTAISSRESSIISHVKVENDFANGTMKMVPIEPSSSTLKSKPWLKKKYEHIVDILDEISKLKRAYGIAEQHYNTP